MADKDAPKLYKNVAVRPPTLEDLTSLATSIGFQCIDSELQQIKEYIEEDVLTSYEEVDEMVAPTLPVKYPRTPGHRPESKDNKYNAWYWKCNIEGAPEGSLKGKRLALKDNICVAGVPMFNGSRIMEEFVPDIDATVVTRIMDAGGRIVGKANCEHLCLSGSSSWSNDTGAILNPHDITRSAGGSSGGCAVAVRIGDADMAIGADQGGSIRVPSSWCGIVGLKPTFGLVPYTGVLPIEITLDHVGPMAKTVQDCALLLEVIAGRDDERDSRQPRDLQVPKYSKLITGDITGKKVGLVTEGFVHCDEAIQKIVKDAAHKLTQAGAIVEEFSLPIHTKAEYVWWVICGQGGYQCMVKGNGFGYHHKGFYSTAIMEKLRCGYANKPDNLSEVMKLFMLFGEYMSRKYGNKFYAKAMNLNMKLTEEYNKALDKYDVLVMPTVPHVAPPLPTKESTLKDRLHDATGMFKNTCPFDCTGFPFLTINAGFCNNLPVGMMIVGKRFDEINVLQVARGYEKLRDGQ